MKKQTNGCAQYGYWCTWLTQNYLAERYSRQTEHEKPKFIGDQGAKIARSMINENEVFGGNGWASKWEGTRQDLYLMLDDGWDVPYGVHPADRRDAFGSLETNEERFPSTAGKAPAERLKILNEKAKAFGWKGIGIWVAAQRCGKDFEKPFSSASEEYWRERISWSKQAGVTYLKIDWGTSEHDNVFRKFLSETAEELYPELVVEHAVCCPPLNGVDGVTDEGLRGRFTGDSKTVELAKEAVSYSEVFRTYDVLQPLSVATTLDRAAYLLPFAKGYLNVEDEVYLAAALGCQTGIMRSAYGIGLDEWDDSERLQEAEATINWQKIAPPFVGGEMLVGEEILFDDYTFRKDETWYWVANGNRIEQGAPASVARNAPLPLVKAGKDGNKPFVALSRHPNGAYAAAVLPRTVCGKRGYVGGEIEFSVSGNPERIAFFGIADRAAFLFDGAKLKSVTAKSILGGEEFDIPVSKEQDGFTVDGTLITRLWRTKDKSAPAIVFTVEYENQGG